MSESSSGVPRLFWLVPVASGLIGFLAGIIGYYNWQVAIETGQIVAGLVNYPPDNPNYVQLSRLWTVMHQASAALFHLGLNERVQSLLLSGVLGAVSFIALALLVYSFCRDTAFSILAPCFIQVTRSAELGASYPIWLMGETHTYGILGLSYALLVVACLGAEYFKSGFFLLGAALCVHPSLGFWLSVVAALAAACKPKESVALVKQYRWWLLSGWAVALVSFIWQYAFTAELPTINSATASQYLDAFTRLWDGHRQPIAFGSPGVIATATSLVISLFWLTVFRNDLPPSSRLVLRILAASGTLGIALAATSHLPPSIIPNSFLVLMPNRLLNLNALALAALLLGIARNYRTNYGVQLLSAVFLAILTVGLGSVSLALADPTAPWVQANLGILRQTYASLKPEQTLVVYAALLTIAVGAPTLWSDRASADRRRIKQAARKSRREAKIETESTPTSPSTNFPWLPHFPLLGAVRWGALGLSFVMLVWLTAAEAERRQGLLLDRTNDPMWGRIAEGKGLLLTAGDLFLIQLRTRRAVLLDGGALDFMPYAPATGPDMQKILQEVYGVDLFNPPPEAYGTGVVPRHFTKPIWEARSREQWQEIGRRFGVGDILAFADWQLQLPAVMRTNDFVYYEIPQ